MNLAFWFARVVVIKNDNVYSIEQCGNSIQAQYGSVWSPVHGGGSGTLNTITLNAGETITAMTLAAGGNGFTCVCYIKIETSAGRTFGPYDGGCGAGSASRYTLGSGLAYLSSASGTLLDSIILNYCSNTNCANGENMYVS